MGLFDFGGSRTRARSEGRSDARSDSSSFGESSSDQGSTSGSIAGGTSTGRSGSSTRQRIAFEDVFARLFGGAEGAAGGLDPSILFDTANELFNSGTGFLDSIGGDAGSGYLSDRLSSRNGVLEDQIGLLQEDIGRLFSEELLPGIESRAISGGALGGGRQGVAQGAAIDSAAAQFTRGATALRAGDIAARDAIAGGIADRSLAGSQLGLSALPTLAGIAELGFGAELAPYERLAAILGDKTVLGDSDSFGFTDASDFARSFSDSFGRSRSRQGSRSSSRSTSRTSSRTDSGSVSLGFI